MIGVVGHDAGAMEIISSYVRRQRLDCGFCLEGPAVNVVTRKLGSVSVLPLDALVAQCDWLLCGTSSFSELEWRAIGLAQQAGKYSVAVLDHWVGYRRRFMRNGKWHWPDEVWVGDETAARIAREELPELQQTLVPNAYFLDIQDEINELVGTRRAPEEGLQILYVCEPLREGALILYGDERYMGYTEEEAMVYFLSNIEVLGNNINRVVIRVHPSENPNKYDFVLNQFQLPVVCGEQKTLLEQILASDIVVGRTTMAMVVGLLAGKRVFSCIPPSGKTTKLPQVGIEDMTQLIIASKLGSGNRDFSATKACGSQLI